MEGLSGTSAELRGRAERYRAMVRLTTDPRIVDALKTLADQCEALANRLHNQAETNRRTSL